MKYSIDELNKAKPFDTLLTALEYGYSERKSKDLFVKCVCNCGNYKTVRVASFLRGGCKSCWCLYSNRAGIVRPQIDELRRCWGHMRHRCYFPKCKEYGNYGAKGVVVCEEWLNSYKSFLEWCLSNGWQKGLALDKDIKASALGVPANLYSPERCMWVTPKENAQIKRGCRYYDFEGQMLNVSQIVSRTGVPRERLIARLNAGMELMEAIYKPPTPGNVPTERKMAYWDRMRGVSKNK